MNNLNKQYKWEGKIYQVDLDAPVGSRVLVKEGNSFVSRPDIGKLGATILFEGEPIAENVKIQKE